MVFGDATGDLSEKLVGVTQILFICSTHKDILRDVQRATKFTQNRSCILPSYDCIQCYSFQSSPGFIQMKIQQQVR